MSEKSIDQIPFSTRELFDKGIAAVEKNNLDYAVTLLMQVLRLEPGFYQAREALRATQHKRSAGKRSLFRKFVGSASSLTRGQVALRTNPHDALMIAEEVLNDDPGNVLAHELLAKAATLAGYPKTAVLSLEVALRSQPSNRQVAIDLAEALCVVGSRARAEKILRDLLKANPGDPDINQRLKNTLADRTLHEGGYVQLEGGGGSFRDILKDKEEARQIEQENRLVKDVEVAATLGSELESRVAQEPENLRLLRDLADLYLKQERFAEAIRTLELYLEKAGVQDPLILEGLRDARLAEFDHRIRSLDPAASSHDAEAAALRQQREEWVLSDAKRRAEANPTDLQIRYELGALHLAAGRIGDAIAELQKSQNNPNRRIASMNLLAQAFARRGMNDLAARKLQEALKEKLVFDEEAKELRYQLGIVLEKMGRKEEAIDQFKAIYEQDIAYRDVMARVDAHYASQ
jgi:tetratricopeptide (TPR) repeat protein